jgi:poly-gamma-glutamate synthesis protein (capsule biosynthesis protein)
MDQILPHPDPDALFEDTVTSALEYLRLAEVRNGPIPHPADYTYPWGDAIDTLDRVAPDLRIINLETAVTRRGRAEPKGINYRMAPENLPSLSAVAIDGCILANNHVLDWGVEGLADTLSALDRSRIARAGAGMDQEEAARPAVFSLTDGGRLLAYGFAMRSSGVPRHWAAGEGRPGVNWLAGTSDQDVEQVARRLAGDRRPGDVILVSIHWGPNWGYEVPEEHRAFARRLIDQAGAHLIHGHSSHHLKGIEFHRGHLILYGCGDLLNDYEGIRGMDEYRPDLVLIYLPSLDAEGRCVDLLLTPFRLAKFRLNHIDAPDDRRALKRLLAMACRRAGSTITIEEAAAPTEEGAWLRILPPGR